MIIDSTIDFEKRRNVPVRYDRELTLTTLRAMKRVAEVKKRREHAFWKNRMAASREKLKAHRKKSESRTSVRLLEPMVDPSAPERIKTKIREVEKPRSALVIGDGRSMCMEID